MGKYQSWRSLSANDRMRPTSPEELDLALCQLKENAVLFAAVTPRIKAGLLHMILPRIREIAETWVRAACAAKRIPFDSPIAGEEWLAGPVVTVRNVRLLEQNLRAIAERGLPPFGRSSHARADGRTAVRVFPTSALDAAMFSGFSADAILKDDDDRAEARQSRVMCFDPEISVALVLGAGNVSSIPPMDVLYKMFVEGSACILKMNPVNEWVGPILEYVFEPLIESNFLKIVYGGADVGAYLCQHPLVDNIHVTGSNETYDSIVWGPKGEVRDLNKKNGTPINRRPVTSELGNVSPVIVMPYAYSRKELAFMARNVVAMVANNASFNCNSGKMLVMHERWPQREEFMKLVAGAFAAVPVRYAYYPGAEDRYDALTARRHLITVGARRDGCLPWTIIPDVDPYRADEPLFTTEPFCSLISQTALAAFGAEDFLRHATNFCNDRLWGTLNATIMIHPKQERCFASELDRAVMDLRYGTVAINHWPGLGFGFVSPPWGGHPSSTPANIQSGTGWVHNTYMLKGIEKTVLRGPLIVFPKPAWFPDNRKSDVIGRKMTRFESSPSWLRLPSVVLTAIRG